MRSQAQQQSNNTVPMSYFSKYILLLIYTFIHKINNHKKIIRLNKILRGRKKKKRKKGDNSTLYNSFGIPGCIIHAICTQGWGQGSQTVMELWRRRCNQADSLWEGKATAKKPHSQEDTCPWVLDKHVLYRGGIPWGATGLCFMPSTLLVGLSESPKLQQGLFGQAGSWQGQKVMPQGTDGVGSHWDEEGKAELPSAGDRDNQDYSRDSGGFYLFLEVLGGWSGKAQSSCAFQGAAAGGSVGKELWHHPSKPWVTFSCLLSPCLWQTCLQEFWWSGMNGEK